jgi:6-pyruvoyltetrahydropterin/6-carboxytetrahydropterin synthase
VITVSKEVEFDAGHRIPSRASKCRNPHGHRYRVRVTCQDWIVEEPGAPDEGMLVDFGDLKTLMTENVHDVLDHGFIVHEDDDDLLRALLTGGGGEWKVIVFPYVPTVENIARWIWEELAAPIAELFRDGLTLHKVEVWETPTSMAVVEADAEAQLLRSLGVAELRFHPDAA